MMHRRWKIEEILNDSFMDDYDKERAIGQLDGDSYSVRRTIDRELSDCNSGFSDAYDSAHRIDSAMQDDEYRKKAEEQEQMREKQWDEP